MPVPALKFNHVTKNYGSSRGVFDLNFSVDKGQIFGFLGPNGAGKTTTIRMILDFIRANEGTIKVLGLDSKRDTVAIHRRIGYLTGDIEMDGRLTGQQYLEYTANLHGNVAWSHVQKLIDQLEAQVDRKISQLSRGNKQKIGLVAALMHKPDLLILDEPTSGLDPLIQTQFQQIIAEHRAAGKTAFISSHVLSEVQAVCDYVGFIREGKLVDVQPLSALRHKAFHKAHITLSRAHPSALKGVKGVQDLHVRGREIDCKITENFGGIIKALAKLPVKDLTIEEASLDDLFMHYYQDEEASNV